MLYKKKAQPFLLFKKNVMNRFHHQTHNLEWIFHHRLSQYNWWCSQLNWLDRDYVLQNRINWIYGGLKLKSKYGRKVDTMDCSIAMGRIFISTCSRHQQTTTMFLVTLIDFIFGNTYLHISTVPVAKSEVEKFATWALLFAYGVKFGRLIEFIKCKMSSMFNVLLFVFVECQFCFWILAVETTFCCCFSCRCCCSYSCFIWFSCLRVTEPCPDWMKLVQIFLRVYV